jgi:T4-like virus tail tube protein gp19
MAAQRTDTAGRFMLDITGVNVGFVKRFSGFAMEADIVSNVLGPANVQKKHVANVRWTPAKATIGIGMGKEMYQWIKAAFDKGYETRNGSFVAADFNYKEKSRLNFQNALITSVTFPKLDGSSKDAAYFDVEFEAEQVRWEKGGGEDIKGKVGAKQRAWLCSNFRIEMGSLPCSRVATVDSFTWKCAVAADQVGIFREPTKHPAKVTVPDIKLSISMADYQPWAEAAKKWFVDGFHEEKDEMTGRIVFLGPDMKTEIGSIDLLNLGFKKFSPNDMEANVEKIARFDVELYCEAMKFNINYYSEAGR